jgi:tight adherence protein B
MSTLVLLLPILTMICGTGAILSMVAGQVRPSSLDEFLDDQSGVLTPQTGRGALESILAIWLDDAELSYSPRPILLSGLLIPSWIALCGIVFGYPPSWILGLSLVPPVAGIATLAIRRNLKRKALREQLPEAVSLLARSTHAGLSIDQAVMVAEETLSGRIAHEFGACRQQLKLGSSLGNAFQAMATRTRNPEVSFLATTLSIHREAGGKLAETLDRLAAVLQDNLTMKRQLRASTSAGRFATKILVPFGPGLFILLSIIQPEHTARFFSSPLGWTVFVTGLVLELLGIAWVLILTKPE